MSADTLSLVQALPTVGDLGKMGGSGSEAQVKGLGGL